MCQRRFSLHFDPPPHPPPTPRSPRRPDPGARSPSPTPVEAGCCLFGRAYRNILTKYWVSATSTPRRGRLTGFASLNLRRQGVNLAPPAHRAGGQRGALRRPRRSPQGPPCHSESTIGKVGARRREQERPKTACRRARKILFIFLYYYYLFAGKHLVAQRGLVFGRGFM